ncbi:MAG: hypothetical protein AAF206_17325 [Bacteroidota bacterium]
MKAQYRKWIADDGFPINYLKVNPDGTMIHLSFDDDDECESGQIVRTKPANQINTQFYLKNREVCKKSEWLKAMRRMKSILKEG